MMHTRSAGGKITCAKEIVHGPLPLPLASPSYHARRLDRIPTKKD